MKNKQHKAFTVSCSWENIAMIAKKIMIYDHKAKAYTVRKH